MIGAVAPGGKARDGYDEPSTTWRVKTDKNTHRPRPDLARPRRDVYGVFR